MEQVVPFEKSEVALETCQLVEEDVVALRERLDGLRRSQMRGRHEDDLCDLWLLAVGTGFVAISRRPHLGYKAAHAVGNNVDRRRRRVDTHIAHALLQKLCVLTVRLAPIVMEDCH